MKKYLPFVVLIGLLVFWPGFTSSQTSQHGSFLTWNASVVDATHSAAASYNVYRATVSGGPYTLIANVTTTSYVDPIAGLTAGNTYFYIVRSVNSVGLEDGPSNEVSGTIPNSAGVVTGLVDAVK